jgi:hypothetical protein
VLVVVAAGVGDLPGLVAGAGCRRRCRTGHHHHSRVADCRSDPSPVRCWLHSTRRGFGSMTGQAPGCCASWRWSGRRRCPCAYRIKVAGSGWGRVRRKSAAGAGMWAGHAGGGPDLLPAWHRLLPGRAGPRCRSRPSSSKRGVGDAVAHSLIWVQLRKSPSAARMAEAMARSRKLRCFLASLPVKPGGRGPKWPEDLRDVHGVAGGLGRLADRAAGNSQTGRAASTAAWRSASWRACFSRWPI